MFQIAPRRRCHGRERRKESEEARQGARRREELKRAWAWREDEGTSCNKSVGGGVGIMVEESLGHRPTAGNEQRQGSRTDGEQIRHTDALRRLRAVCIMGSAASARWARGCWHDGLGVVPHVVDAAQPLANLEMHQQLGAAPLYANAPPPANPAVVREPTCLSASFTPGNQIYWLCAMPWIWQRALDVEGHSRRDDAPKATSNSKLSEAGASAEPESVEAAS